MGHSKVQQPATVSATFLKLTNSEEMYTGRKRNKKEVPEAVPVVIRNGIPVPLHILKKEEIDSIRCIEELGKEDEDQETGEITFEMESFDEEPYVKRQKATSCEDEDVLVQIHEEIISLEHEEECVQAYARNSPCQNSDLISFNVGDKFDSYEAFSDCLQLYKEQNSVEFVKRDARTVESASKRLSRVFRDGLKYYEVNMRCVHGGKVVSKAKTTRRCKESLKIGCPAYITLRSTSDGMFLEVKSLKMEHNHKFDMDVIRNRGTTKQLPKNLKDRAVAMLAANVDKDVVGKMISDETGELHTKRIVSNLLALVSKMEKQTVLNRVFRKLQLQNEGTIDYFPEKYELKGILFQDSDMRAALEAYPEIVTIVSTGRLKERACAHVFLVEDSLGQPEVVALGILASDKEPNFSNLLELFKVRNASLQDGLKVIVSDRDETTVEHVKSVFPNATCFLVKDAVTRTMKKAVNALRLSEDAKVVVLEWVEKFLKVRTDVEYSATYNQFSEEAAKFLDYYNEKWHGIIPSWVLGLSFRTEQVMPTTLNWISVISDRLSKLEDTEVEIYIDELFSIASELKQARLRALTEFSEMPHGITHDIPRSVEEQFAQMVTPYACHYINTQLTVPEVELMESDTEETYQVDTWEGIVTVTTHSCTCIFHRHFGLPCAHIFACRHHLEKEVFDETLYDHRWTLSYLKESIAALQDRRSQTIFASTEVEQHWTLEDWKKSRESETEENGHEGQITVIEVSDIETSHNL